MDVFPYFPPWLYDFVVGVISIAIDFVSIVAIIIPSGIVRVEDDIQVSDLVFVHELVWESGIRFLGITGANDVQGNVCPLD